jgi:tRNA threonylcarbamoyladenosine biosynthesis protein TsaB
MPLILNIDTATEVASICISEKDEVLGSISNEDQKQHASFLQAGIKSVLDTCGIKFNDLSAVSVTAGPGSYTGLRVGIASAKGFCYALKIPLILLNTLEVMAIAAIKSNKTGDGILYCPMIDARRTEVFTAVYNEEMEEIIFPCVMKIENNSFLKLLDTQKIFFIGSGAKKTSAVMNHRNAIFADRRISPIQALAYLSFQKFEKQSFTDVALADALYIKEFFTIS